MNRARRILLGATLLLAAGCSGPPAPPADEPAAPDRSTLEYTVREGDTWGRISEVFFGDASRARRIAEENESPVAIDPVVGSEVTVTVTAAELEQVRGIAEARGSYNAGVQAMQQDGQEELAAEAFARAVERAPWFVDARYNLGLVQLRLGRPAEARQNFRRVVDERPDDPEAWYALAAACFHAGDYGAALPGLERALGIDPSLLRARWTLALCLQRMGRSEEAIAAWRAYLELDSTSAWATQAREHLAELGT